METDEIQRMRSDIETLKAQIADLRAALEFESANTTQFIKEYGNGLADAFELLMPVVYKVFPNYAASKKSVDQFLARFSDKSARKRPPLT